MRTPLRAILVALAASFLLAPGSLGATLGYRLTDARGQQRSPLLTSDLRNSAWLFWADNRTSVTYRLYAQRFDSLGVKQLAADGIAVATPQNPYPQSAITDSLGGAWLTYTAVVGLNTEFRAQHIDSTGASTADLSAPFPAGWTCVSTALSGTNDLLLLGRHPSGGWNIVKLAANGKTTFSVYPEGSGSRYVDWYLFDGALSSDGLGGGFVAVTRRPNATTPAINLEVEHFGADGTRAGKYVVASFTPTTYPTSNNETPLALVARSPGIAHLVYSLNRPYATTPSMAILSAESGLQGSFPLLPSDANYYGYPRSLYVTAEGHSIIVTESGASRYDENGAPVMRYDWPSVYNDCYGNHGPRNIAVSSNGILQLAWTDARDRCTRPSNTAIAMQFLTSSGTPIFANGNVRLRQAPDGDNRLEGLQCAALGTRSLSVWTDNHIPSDTDLYGQLVDMSGTALLPDADALSLTAVRDTPHDQGGKVALSWRASSFDNSDVRAIVGYRVWRRIPRPLASRSHSLIRATTHSTSHFGFAAASTEYWESVAEVPAQRLSGYGAVVATTQDSLAGSNPYTAFFVSALTENPFVFYDSPVDSGYSVDNLPPRAPLFAGARYDAGQSHLHWLPNTEADLNGYILYRGTHPDFVIDVTDPVAFVADTGYVDAATGPMYYKIAAVDRHGNRSPYITVLPTGNAGVGGGGLSLAFSLARPYPNPSDGSSLNVEFTLPTAAPATLEVLDVLGRCVLRDALAGYAAGRHTIDIARRVRLASGLYVVRLQQAGMSRDIRVTLLQ